MGQGWDAYRLEESVRGDAVLRGSFNRLAQEVFGLDFEPWHQKGLWTDSYQPFTLFEGARAIANVSANRFTLVLNGERKRAVQFGTVMTHPEYRGQGLASRLMRHAMDKLRPACDLFYLMGDRDAVGFYRKLGFASLPQTTYRLKLPDKTFMTSGKSPAGPLNAAHLEDKPFMTSSRSPAKPLFAPQTEDRPGCVHADAPAGPVNALHLQDRVAGAFSRADSAGFGRYLDFSTQTDMDLLQRLAARRAPVSLRAGLLDATHLLTFYAMNGYGDKCLFLPEAETGEPDLLVIMENSEGVLTLHDVLFTQPVSLNRLLSLIPHGEIAEIAFGFVPDRLDIQPRDGTLLAEPMVMEDAFFSMPADAFGDTPFLYPPIGLA